MNDDRPLLGVRFNEAVMDSFYFLFSHTLYTPLSPYPSYISYLAIMTIIETYFFFVMFDGVEQSIPNGVALLVFPDLFTLSPSST